MVPFSDLFRCFYGIGKGNGFIAGNRDGLQILPAQNGPNPALPAARPSLVTVAAGMRSSPAGPMHRQL